MNDIQIKQINEKNPDAFRILYQTYYKALVYYTMQQIDSLEAAEDIVQELFISIWEKNLQFSNDTSFRVYLYNSIRNSSINYIRHKEVEANYQKLNALIASEEVEEEIHFIFEDNIYKELFRIIDDLPKRSREVLLLLMEGKKVKEVAESLNITVETVKTHKKRAILFIRKHLDKSTYFLFVLYAHQIFS
jgi:RNA polymerase sigma-70 factor (family 1)